MSFEDLGLGPDTLKALADCGYTTPTPIQAQAIPQILMARDLVGLAQTGTGKTASFTLPMIEILSTGRARARMPRSLILSPTRELAAQIAENFDIYGKYHPLSKALLVGGTSMEEQIKNLERGVDVLIATPGRLLDLFERGRILLSDIKIFVIDEADRMLDMGFIPDIEKIASKLPAIRQTLLFSATMPPEIKKLTAKFLSNPREVSVAPPATTAANVEQFLVWTSQRNKPRVLARLIAQENVQSALIFCNRKRDIDGVCRLLQSEGYAAKPMHGDMVQKVRTETLQAFKDSKIQLMVCSDVAARGIDIDDLSHVFNYDVPANPDDYVHRIGRTGRAGKTGRAWTLALAEHDDKLVQAIEKRINKPVPVYKLEGADLPGKQHQPQDSRLNTARPSRPGVKAAPRKAHAPAPMRQPVPEAAHANPGAKGFGDGMPDFFKVKG
ncbi:MAG: DEAD/DEAH box helicase [Alphaproteobacteria bacterium]|nr:DEAD/DEAH box helicase [Alphaproteobacteria bacterium]